VKEDDEEYEGNLDDILHEEPSAADSTQPADGLTSEIENRQPRRLYEKEVKVMGVYEHQEQGLPFASRESYFVLLRDNQGRQVLIWIGRFEALAISVALEGAAYDRPMTHDLLKSVVDRLGGRIERIVIDDLWQDTYYAKISVQLNGHGVDIDARPSDAIALALRSRSPIFVAEAVLEQSAKESEET